MMVTGGTTMATVSRAAGGTRQQDDSKGQQGDRRHDDGDGRHDEWAAGRWQGAERCSSTTTTTSVPTTAPS